MTKKGLVFAAILFVSSVVSAYASNTNTNISYNYDSLGRLVQVQYAAIGSIAYTYDATGNMTQKVTVAQTTPAPSPTPAPTPTPTPSPYFKEDFSGNSGYTWTSGNGNWYVDSTQKLNVSQITSGKMANYKTAFHPASFFTLDTDVNVVSIANGGGFGIIPFASSGATLFTASGMTLNYVGAMLIYNGSAYTAGLLGFDSTGGKWAWLATLPMTSSVTSIGVAYSSNAITLRINKQNTTTSISGAFSTLPSLIDSLELVAQGDGTQVQFDNVYAAPLVLYDVSDCTATLDANLALHIPYLTYSGLTLWADLAYDYIQAYSKLIIFKYVNLGIITNPSLSCTAATLSSDLTVHIPDILYGTTHLWADLTYNAAISTDGNLYFVVTNVGTVPSL